MTGGLSAIVLAAGHARRFGADKLLQRFNGAPLVTHAVNAALAAPVARVVIVKRPGLELDRVCRAAAARHARIEIIEIASDALSDSLSAGLAAVSGGAFIFLGDMPLIPPNLPALLKGAIGERLAAVPTCEGRPGHPVLLSARAAPLAVSIIGDHGLGSLLRQNAHDVAYLETHDPRVVLDIDTAEDYARLSGERPTIASD